MNHELATQLAEETGAGRDDPTLCAAASQISWFHSLVFAEIGRRLTLGHTPDEIAGEVLELLGTVEELLGEKAFSYAVREEPEEQTCSE
jgi:hypothetical protein